jgi:hypothetical protein
LRLIYGMALTDKLKLKNDRPVWLIDVPAAMQEYFEGFELKKKLPATKTVGQLFFCAKDKKMLESGMAAIKDRIAPGAVLWIAYPKRTGNIPTDLTRDEGWAGVWDMGFMGTASASIDDNWTGMRIKLKDPNEKYIRDTPMEERVTEGVDYVKRTTTLPKDAVAAMKPYKGLEAFFYSISFSHQREHMEALAGAKKPETRQRRIEKMVEMLLKMQVEKKKK